MPDPCTLDIDGVVLGLTSTDLLFHLGTEEISRWGKTPQIWDFVISHPFFPCFSPFFALFPRFLTLQLLWDLGSLHADPPAHPDAAQVSAAAPKWGFFGAKPGDFCTASLLSSSERQIYPPRGDLSHVWGFGGISDPSEAESKGIWSWRCSAFLNYGFCDPSGAELAGFGAVLSQDLSFLGSGDPIGGGWDQGGPQIPLLPQTPFPSSYYPLYPPAEEMNVDYESFSTFASLPVTPHVLVTPSELRYFVKV